ncbi:hypothetical protein [Nonomuraea sp. NPDC049129]|uniref:hypothetical protein n=1 Tax=Nonomuraea sp. NPDC049129 TaxID=3155272 RepID=UPI0033DE9BF1
MIGTSTDVVLKAQIPNRGLFQISTRTLDLMITRYLPADLPELCAEIDRRWREDLGQPLEIPARYEVHTITEALFILAELDGLGL